MTTIGSEERRIAGGDSGELAYVECVLAGLTFVVAPSTVEGFFCDLEYDGKLIADLLDHEDEGLYYSGHDTSPAGNMNSADVEAAMRYAIRMYARG